ncbi:hypothetical protein [Aequorivita viscosa]|uniref:hypothetical protein n=1 Tax=Aequorivita viscosa TaxID=797419 RepID=UPI001160097E|nr:hypothetical protein [Aequorivita viscosa]
MSTAHLEKLGERRNELGRNWGGIGELGELGNWGIGTALELSVRDIQDLEMKDWVQRLIYSIEIQDFAQEILDRLSCLVFVKLWLPASIKL